MKCSGIAALAPSFYMSRLLGLTPVRAKRNRDGSLEFAARGILLVISIAHISGIAYVSCYMSETSAILIDGFSPLASYTGAITLSCYGSIGLLGTAFFHRRKTVRAFSEIYQLSRLLMGHSDHNELLYEASFTSFSYISTTSRFFLLISNFDFWMRELVAYHYSYLIHLSSHSLITGSLFYLGSFFECLNSELSQIGLKLSSMPTEMETSLILRHLKELRKTHNRICNLCDLICERFSLDIFITFAVFVVHLLATFYSDVWAQSINLTRLISTTNVMQYVFIFLQLARLCHRNDYVMEQSEVTSAKVRSLMATHLPAEIKQEIYHLMLQTMLRKVGITACGFYGLRMETITTLAYLLTTYFVMVVNLAGD